MFIVNIWLEKHMANIPFNNILISTHCNIEPSTIRIIFFQNKIKDILFTVTGKDNTFSSIALNFNVCRIWYKFNFSSRLYV